MPLRARVTAPDGSTDDVVAPLVDDAGWAALVVRSRRRADTLVMPCCGFPAIPRVSKLGLRHFAHRRSRGGVAACEAPRESLEHLWAKAAVATFLTSLGFAVIAEAAGTDWRADVLGHRPATRPGETPTRIVIEIQLASQSFVDTAARQARYARDGLKAIWLFRRLPAHTPTREMPMFALTVERPRHRVEGQIGAPTFAITVGGTSLPLETFLAALLARRIRFSPRLRTRRRQVIRPILGEVRCPKCQTAATAYTFQGEMRGPCGLALAPEAWKPFDSVGGFEPDLTWCVAPEGRAARIEDVPPWVILGPQELNPTVEFYRPSGYYPVAGRRTYLKRRWGYLMRPIHCPLCGHHYGTYDISESFFAKPPLTNAERLVHLTTPLYEDRPHCELPPL